MPTSPLPDESNWRFDELAASDQGRASALERAGTPGELLNAVVHRLAVAAQHGDVRFGSDRDDSRGGRRAIIQFPVGLELFNWFSTPGAGTAPIIEPVCGRSVTNCFKSWFQGETSTGSSRTVALWKSRRRSCWRRWYQDCPKCGCAPSASAPSGASTIAIECRWRTQDSHRSDALAEYVPRRGRCMA